MFSKVSAIFALTSVALAIPAPSTPTDKYFWTVHNLSNKCTAATCYYDFNVTAEAGPNSAPSFSAYGCEGTNVQGEFKPCTTLGIDIPGEVTTNEESAIGGTAFNVFVQFKYKAGNTQYIVTGNETVPKGADAREFKIYASQIAAVPDKA
ncbi:hypothetical protein EJ04DRAFT_430350 [Polyplosphaeria fusca]|uniref:Uncharacterized protein n=1 Tax=Polyplosphaeria fusca TaxID=682080 RepID=A0A9P4R6S9_9PLEO|nr:hypothetical protein EJ04DRAFT_430350 [Polyplosphaeria fusca]